MNLFKNLTNAETEIEKQSRIIISLCLSVMKKINPNTDSIPCFVEYGRYHICTQYQENSFSGDSVYIILNENGDPYEDYETDNWSINLPVSLYLSNDMEKIEEHFVKLNEAKLKQEAKRQFDNKWNPIMHYSISDIELYLSKVKPFLWKSGPSEGQHFHWIHHDELLKELADASNNLE